MSVSVVFVRGPPPQWPRPAASAPLHAPRPPRPGSPREARTQARGSPQRGDSRTRSRTSRARARARGHHPVRPPPPPEVLPPAALTFEPDSKGTSAPAGLKSQENSFTFWKERPFHRLRGFLQEGATRPPSSRATRGAAPRSSVRPSTLGHSRTSPSRPDPCDNVVMVTQQV